MLLLISCSKKKQIHFKFNSFSSENNALVDVNIPLAEGHSKATNTINNEIKRVVSLALKIDENKTDTDNSIEQSINLFNKEYNKFSNDFPNVIQPWEAQIDGEIVFQSNDIICVSITSYKNTGGAHGLLYITFLNFDVKTGERLNPEDIFKSNKDFKSLAELYFNKTIKDQNLLLEPDNFKLPQNIGFNDQGLILLYNTYEIAPYSAGIIEYLIPADEISDFLVQSPY
ncbi:DUF3298 and DUF4163 domain-containing protein [Aestuariibaculum sediminum]|uniref:DUF4163 domain-containing protein n=1 Tax=Aestuariibaculum sediminum TaxID=2770637 RepID=A0A8J6Q1Y4_9FLAO|nr:DUF3298 and DUF4163 domain-containing protein [Aestuariibaculum sediminum]MBD0831431.1 DUF4163 domain-containing protein [Aestuariibaculum sediminum]